MNKMLLQNTIQKVAEMTIDEARQMVLQPLIRYIQNQIGKGEAVRLNFICTHNSRRSHLAQVWAQTMAHHFSIKNIFCYSGGTETTAMFPKIGETMQQHGFDVIPLSVGENPIFAIKFDNDEAPVVAFSKVYEHPFNPKSQFAAVLTCKSADENCPVVFGAQQRIPIPFDDPKAFDGTPQMDEKYRECSLEIAAEMFFVFKNVEN